MARTTAKQKAKKVAVQSRPTVEDLYARMLTHADRLADVGKELGVATVSGAPQDGPAVTMSVRVPRRVRAYYEAQARACGAASPSAMVAMVLQGVMLATQTQSRD